jgi:hypothetical protein
MWLVERSMKDTLMSGCGNRAGVSRHVCMWKLWTALITWSTGA